MSEYLPTPAHASRMDIRTLLDVIAPYAGSDDIFRQALIDTIETLRVTGAVPKPR